MSKIALVTGSTKGIGLAITQALLANGCRVILNYAHDDIEAQNINKLLLEQYEGHCFTIIKADLSTFAGLNILLEGVTKFAKKIDYLVLNTAITDKTPFAQISEQKWQKVIDTNLNIPFFLTQALSEQMQHNGRIIFIGAVLGIFPHATSISYGVSKAGLHFLAKSLVKEFADRNITVNVVAPGFVNTPWQDNKSPEHRQRIEMKTALRRFAAPEEIAQMVISIIENAYINGAIVQLDGGYCYQ